MNIAFCLSDVTIAYHGHPAVHHVSGDFEAGSLTAIVGPNGAGKSTLLSALAGLRRPTHGKIERGSNLSKPGAVAFLAQLSGINSDFPLRVLEVVAMGAWPRVGALGKVDEQERKAIALALEQVGLKGFEDRLVDELSVGQLQRVLFARLIVQDAPVILLDEPFSALDAVTTRDLLGVVSRWHQQGRTVIVVLHDLDMVRQYFPRTLLIARELVSWGPTAQALSNIHLAQANQRSLAWQDTASWCEAPAVKHVHPPGQEHH
ncbi:MAG: ABC transporter ATP-binding protein [Burkholderiaceae bacterium]|nr:ABC transporter ATP-binding protein [Burkholderiaceae bacterium]